MIKERRKHPRLRIPLEAEYLVAGREEWRQGTIWTLGAGGAALLCEEKLERGTDLEGLRFVVEAEGDLPETRIEVGAEVVSIDRQADFGRASNFMLGLQFRRLGEQEFELLRQFVFRRLTEQAKPGSQRSQEAPRAEPTPIEIRFKLFDEFVEEVSENLSPSGMFIRANRPLPPGARFVFQFQLGDDFSLFHGTAEVVWTRRRSEGPDRPPGMGVRFVHLDLTSQKMVRRLVDPDGAEPPAEIARADQDADRAPPEAVREAGHGEPPGPAAAPPAAVAESAAGEPANGAVPESKPAESALPDPGSATVDFLVVEEVAGPEELSTSPADDERPAESDRGVGRVERQEAAALAAGDTAGERLEELEKARAKAEARAAELGEEAEALRRENETLRGAAEAADEARGRAEAEALELRRELDRASSGGEDHEDELASLREQLAGRRGEWAELESELRADLERRVAAEMELRERLELADETSVDLRRGLERAAETEAALRERLAQAEAEAEETESHKQRADAADEAAEERRQELDEMRREWQATESELRAQLEQKSVDEAAARQRLEEAAGAEAELRQRMSELRGARDEMEQRLAQSGEVEAALREQAQELRGQRDDLERKLGRAARALEALRGAAAEMKSRLNGDLDSARALEADLSDRLAEVAVLGSGLDRKVAGLAQARAGLADRLTRIGEAWTRLETGLRASDELDLEILDREIEPTVAGPADRAEELAEADQGVAADAADAADLAVEVDDAEADAEHEHSPGEAAGQETPPPSPAPAAEAEAPPAASRAEAEASPMAVEAPPVAAPEPVFRVEERAEPAPPADSETVSPADPGAFAEAAADSAEIAQPEVETPAPPAPPGGLLNAARRVAARFGLGRRPEETAAPPPEDDRLMAVDSQEAVDEPGAAPELPGAEAIEETVRAWAAAWSERRVEDYLSFYSERFEPSRPNGDGDAAEAPQAWLPPLAGMELTLGPISRTELEPGRFAVQFEQSVESDSYTRRTGRTLEMVLESDSWKIAAESFQELSN